MYSFPNFEPVCCSMSSSNCCFLICIQVSQEAGKVVWYSHLFQNLPQFVVIYTVKGVSIVNKAEVDAFLDLSCFFYDPLDVGNLISGSSAFSKPSLNIWKFLVQVLLKLSESESISHSDTSDFAPRTVTHQAPLDSPGNNTGVVVISFSRGYSQPRDWSPGLLHCGHSLHCQSQQGSPAKACVPSRSVVTPWSAAHKAPLSIEFSRQEC